MTCSRLMVCLISLMIIKSSATLNFSQCFNLCELQSMSVDVKDCIVKTCAEQILRESFRHDTNIQNADYQKSQLEGQSTQRLAQINLEGSHNLSGYLLNKMKRLQGQGNIQ